MRTLNLSTLITEIGGGAPLGVEGVVMTTLVWNKAVAFFVYFMTISSVIETCAASKRDVL